MGPPPRIALVHGHRRILAFLEFELTKNGFAVRSAEDANDGFELVREWKPDVIVIDVKVPGLDGIAFLRLLRLYTVAPIVVLGVSLDLPVQVACLESGADHCVSLPADMQEIVAVMRSLLRRPGLRDPDVRVLADLEINTRARTAQRRGRELGLTRQEFDVLATLMAQPSRVFSRQELLATVWGSELNTTYRAVDACIAGLRRKLDAPFGAPILRTIRGVGFTVRPSR